MSRKGGLNFMCGIYGIAIGNFYGWSILEWDHFSARSGVFGVDIFDSLSCVGYLFFVIIIGCLSRGWYYIIIRGCQLGRIHNHLCLLSPCIFWEVDLFLYPLYGLSKLALVCLQLLWVQKYLFCKFIQLPNGVMLPPWPIF